MESEKDKLKKEAEKIADTRYGRASEYICPEDYTDKSLAIFAAEIEEKIDKKLSTPNRVLIENINKEINKRVEEKTLEYVLEVKKLKRLVTWMIVFFGLTFVYIILRGIK